MEFRRGGEEALDVLAHGGLARVDWGGSGGSCVRDLGRVGGPGMLDAVEQVLQHGQFSLLSRLAPVNRTPTCIMHGANLVDFAFQFPS